MIVMYLSLLRKIKPTPAFPSLFKEGKKDGISYIYLPLLYKIGFNKESEIFRQEAGIPSIVSMTCYQHPLKSRLSFIRKVFQFVDLYHAIHTL
jgi:hypothetical protein